MPLWLSVPGEGPRKDCGGKLLAGISYREGGESGGVGVGGDTMKRICPQRKLVDG